MLTLPRYSIKYNNVVYIYCSVYIFRLNQQRNKHLAMTRLNNTEGCFLWWLSCTASAQPVSMSPVLWSCQGYTLCQPSNYSFSQLPFSAAGCCLFDLYDRFVSALMELSEIPDTDFSSPPYTLLSNAFQWDWESGCRPTSSIWRQQNCMHIKDLLLLLLLFWGGSSL